VQGKAARWLPLAALLVFTAGLALRPMAETDLFFHLKAGQEILRRQGLPGRNLFSFTYPDYPDIDTSWLSEVAAALVFAVAGFPGVVVAKTLVLLAAFGGGWWVAVKRGAGPAVAACALAAAAYAGRDRLVERPLVFSFAGEVAALAAIDALRSRQGRAALRSGALFVGVVVLWANLHAGVFVAPLLVGAAAVAEWLREERASARRLTLLAAAALLAMLLTPVGPGLFRYLALHVRLPALHPVDEFRAPTWRWDAPLWTYAAAVALVAGAAATLGQRQPLLDLIPAIPLAVLAARTVRFGADFALVSAPALALALTALVRRAAARWPRAAAAGPAVAAVALVGLAVAPRLGPGAPAGIGLDTTELPLEAIAFANAEGLRDRMYNDFEVGSYLLFDPVGGFPRHRVFVDPRIPSYPPEMHRLLGRGDLSRAEWDRAMDRYGVETALLAYAGINRRVAWWDPARWALVWNAGDARIFVRRLPRFAALVAAREVPATFIFTEEEGTETVPLDQPPAGSPVARCEWDRRLGDLLVELDGRLSARARAAYDRALAAPPPCLSPADEAHLAAWLGGVELQAGRPAQALRLLDRAQAEGDQGRATALNRAAALEAVGRREEAARERASGLGPRASGSEQKASATQAPR
jgi:hypothetical protein